MSAIQVHAGSAEIAYARCLGARAIDTTIVGQSLRNEHSNIFNT